jgi:hypothetical protein
MDVWCVYAFFCFCVVLYLGSGLATSWSPVQGDLPSVKWSRHFDILVMASIDYVTNLAQNVLTRGAFTMISGNINAFILTFCVNKIQYEFADRGRTVYAPIADFTSYRSHVTKVLHT